MNNPLKTYLLMKYVQENMGKVPKSKTWRKGVLNGFPDVKV